jgi:hypothetical protein
MFLVLRVEDNRVISVTGVTSELSWGHPFTLENTLMKFPPEIFGGKRLLVLALRHPGTQTGVGYYRLDAATQLV